MGLPSMNVIFTATAEASIKRSDRGAVGMIVKGEVPEGNPLTIRKLKDMPESVSADTKEQVRLALKGFVSAPSKVVLYTVPEPDEGEEADYAAALEYFSIHRVNWLCCPTVETDGQKTAVIDWVKEQRAERNRVKAVLPNAVANDEGIINYATESASIEDKEYSAEKFCSRIAGLLAGTPITRSSTFAVLDDVESCTDIQRSNLDEMIDAGKLVIYDDGEKIKVARGVNSLTTVQAGKKNAWKKITVVETMDMVHDDLIMLVEDNYIGKYRNTYDNKGLLLSSVKAYFREIEKTGALEGTEVELDAEAIRSYLMTQKGMDPDAAEEMTDVEARKQYTDDKVFLKASTTVVDTMEDITIEIAV